MFLEPSPDLFIDEYLEVTAPPLPSQVAPFLRFSEALFLQAKPVGMFRFQEKQTPFNPIPVELQDRFDNFPEIRAHRYGALEFRWRDNQAVGWLRLFIDSRTRINLPIDGNVPSITEVSFLAMTHLITTKKDVEVPANVLTISEEIPLLGDLCLNGVLRRTYLAQRNQVYLTDSDSNLVGVINV